MTRRAATHTSRSNRRNWTKQVTQNSHAMDLEAGVFRKESPGAIARSLKNSAEASNTRKAEPFRSALSMLTFYINRAGSKLPVEQKNKLQKAKTELRKLFDRPT